MSVVTHSVPFVTRLRLNGGHDDLSPTGMSNDLGHWHMVDQIARRIEETPPGLADRREGELLVMVKTVNGRSVIAGQVRFGRFLDWTVVDGLPESAPYRVQDRGVSALVDEAIRRVDAELAAA